MKDNFKIALEKVLEHEGGFVNHPKDPGGMTNLGVTRAVYEKWVGRIVDEDEMRSLKPDDVAPIYKRQYWDRISGDKLPAGVDYAVFDFAVNAGVKRASKALQSIVSVEPDGVIGNQTLAALSVLNPADVIDELRDVRQDFYESLPHFVDFGKGWTRRNNDVLESATMMT